MRIPKKQASRIILEACFISFFGTIIKTIRFDPVAGSFEQML